MPESKKAIIIGAGVAGLATAVRLAVKGFSVSVYERNHEPGGKLTSFINKGFIFDKGPSLFTQPQNLQEIFSDAGEDINSYFQYKKCEVNCRYFFEDGTELIAWADTKRLQQELKEKFNEAEQNIENYLSNSKNLYQNIASIFLNFSLHKKATWLHKRIMSALGVLKIAYLTKSLHQYNSACFKNPKTVQIFDRYATYNGSNPYQAPAMLSVIAHLEYNEGSFYAEGGMINITNALYDLAKKKGVKFNFESNVDRINIEQNKATGVEVNGETINADVVVNNIDVYYTYKNLLQNEKAAARVLKQERSSSALIFYWGMSKSFPQLGLHNIFFAEDYQLEFEHIFKTKKIYDDPTIYINITSKENSSHAPAGKENWFVMINVPASENMNWEEFILQARTNILQKLSRLLKCNVEALIDTENIMTPKDIDASTGSYLGSLYGTSSNSPFAAFLRHPNFSNAISNLYFCGGSVHPGGGIPLCLKSAKIVSELVARGNL